MSKHLRSLAEAACALREGRITARHLLEDCREARNPRLEAYQYWDPDRSGPQADLADAAFASGLDLGPLHGIPVSVKDIYGLGGYPTCAGSPVELSADWSVDGPLMRRTRRQLAVITGKTRTVEFAYGGIGTNEHWPRVRNPWDPERVSGGSSTGAGVSVAEGSSLLAFGTDTAGSVRIPASFNGVAGLKTTTGRWPIEAIVPLSPTLDTPGLLARSVEDLAMGFAALDGAEAIWRPLPRVEADLSGLRIGIPSLLFFDDCDPGIAETVREALGELEKAGARLVPAELPGVAQAYEFFRAGSVQAPEIYEFLSNTMPDRLDGLGRNVRDRVLAGKEMPAVEYIRRRRLITAMADRAAEVFAAVDVVATPTVAITPPRFDEVDSPEPYRDRNLRALRNTAIANLMRLCALTLPVGLDWSGMPVGLQLMAAAMNEPALLDIGRRVEAVTGTGESRIGLPPAVAPSTS